VGPRRAVAGDRRQRTSDPSTRTPESDRDPCRGTDWGADRRVRAGSLRDLANALARSRRTQIWLLVATLLPMILLGDATPQRTALLPAMSVSLPAQPPQPTRTTTVPGTTTASMTTATPPTTDPATAAAIARDARWILRAQLPDGAIATHLDHAAIWPYLGNYAAIGLVEATRRAGDRRYLQAAWRWLAWYQAHQDARGFVTDYRRSGGVMVSTGDMDSTDAYAGTFLLAARAALRASGDRARLATLRRGIGLAVRAIEATQDRDGLTWAKPSWRVKYLMDQAETYAGLRAASDLALALDDPALAGRATDDADRLRAGVAALWNPATGAYDWAKHDTGARQRTNWRVLYPDALQQVWAVAFGLVDPERASWLVARFGVAQPRWDRPMATAVYDNGRRAVGYWALVGWAYARIGQPQRAHDAAARIRAAAAVTRRQWPFTPSDAAQLVVLQAPSIDLLGP
jgi:hypothetical protein